MPSLAAQTSALAGVSLTFTAAAASQTFPADGRCILVVRNTNAATRTVTIKSYASASAGLAVTDQVSITVPATTGVVAMGPFGGAFANTNAEAEITWSATAGVDVAVLRVNPA